MPKEIDAERITFEEGIIKTWNIMAPEALKGITEEYGTNIRFFASADGAKNYTEIWCRTGGRMMIPSRSERQAGAWEFIKTVLSYECQISNEEFFRNGFPVIAEAFDKLTSELDNEEKNILDRFDKYFEVHFLNTMCHILLVMKCKPFLEKPCVHDFCHYKNLL